MTSKRLFFRVMREDMRHRIWMAALSALESFLALPVAWLIVKNQLGGAGADTRLIIQDIFTFFSGYLTAVGSLIAVSSVLTASLGGFRFLFHKNMVDTYHSLPVSRNVLFGACYVNGIILWFVPFFGGLISAFTLAGGLLCEVGGRAELYTLMGIVAESLLVLTVIFLLLYNLILVAVMISGNVLNSIVSMFVLGFGSSIVYAFLSSFMTLYLDTFWDRGLSHRRDVIFASPMLSSIYLAVLREEAPEEIWVDLLINLVIAIVLGLWAWHMYKKRSSELAEQGTKSRIATTFLRILVSVSAGMGGWLLFVVLTDIDNLGWGLFGGILGGVMAFGLMNVMFSMDFKSFFAHKGQMAFVLIGTLLLCCVYRGDWMGYDTYLPRGGVAEIAVYQQSLNSNRYRDGTILGNMHFADEEAIYAFLERMVERERTDSDEEDEETMVVRVTRSTGKSYFREYLVRQEDLDVIWPLFNSREYLENAYCVDETVNWSYLAFLRGRETTAETLDRQEMVTSIIRAYNQDVLENPQVILSGGERLLVTIDLRGHKNRWQQWYRLDVYESMEHTVEALRQAGYGEWVETPDASQIQEVQFDLSLNASRPLTAEELIAEARAAFSTGSDAAWRREDYSVDAVSTSGATEIVGERYQWRLHVTDPNEIEELALCLSHAYSSQNVLHSGYSNVTVVYKDGSEEICYIQRSMLPEKYILRFGE
ncbi:MAG: ABC transporter permease [Candidatus Gastranaerophilales bacterium]|nr:ABC transporter permease [Candidatus Gastranaerophilales bacterium]